MRRLLPLAVLTALLPAPARAASSATVTGMDLYRSASLTAREARVSMGGRLESFLQLRAGRKRATEKPAQRLKQEIEALLKEKHGLAFAELSYGEYFTSAGRTAYVTFDVVDKADAPKRMPFRAAPAGKVQDPEGLLAAWQQFSALGEAQLRAGLFTGGRPECPAFYCTWPASTPEAAELQRKIKTGVLPNRKPLEEVLAKDADPAKRAAALYVLAYLPDGADVSRAALDSLSDPSAEVRAAGLQILADLSLYHKTVVLDLSRLLPALDFPTTGDRGKALSVLVGLVENEAYRSLILQRALPALLALLKTGQPNNHDLAFTVLATLSQESYGRHDLEAWRKWAERQTAGATELPGVSIGDAP